jgi:ELWxxDGT repeat protein
MKRFFKILLLLLCFKDVSAQLELIAELNFPERAILRQEEFDRFRYVKDGDHHLLSALIAGKRQSIVYNASTGEVNSTNYVVENPWVFKSGRIYPGWPVDNQMAGWTYLRFEEDGQFYPRPALPAFPYLIAGDIAFGLQQRNVYEMAPFSSQHRLLFTLPNTVSTSDLGWQLVDSTLYIPHGNGVFVYDLRTDSLSTPFDGYIEDNNLFYLPYSDLAGRFLFRVIGEEEGLTLHEVGHGMEPRLIPQGENPPNVGSVSFSVSNGFRPRAVANGGERTWLTYFTQAESGFYNSHLLKIERGQNKPAMDEVSNYEGSIILYEYNSTPSVYSLENGVPVALGWYGPEGCEPFGFINDELNLLADFYEGDRGSVNYASGDIVNMPSWLMRHAFHNDNIYFPALSTYFGTEIAVSDGTPAGTRILADLESGIRGIRAVEFYTLEEDLYFAVQKDDLSFAIYRQGSILQPSPEIPDPYASRDWEVMLGNTDGTGEIRHFENHDGATPITQDGSVITYLSPRLDPTSRQYPDTMLNQQLIQIDMATGTVFREKRFKGGLVAKSKLLPGEEGGVNIIRLGGPDYRDSQNDTTLENYYDASEKLFMVQFDAELNFQGIKKLLGTSSFREYDQLNSALAVDDGFVLLTRDYWDSYFWLLHFSHDGELIKNIAIPRERGNIQKANLSREPDGNFQLVIYETRYNCDDCEVRILRYSPDLKLKETWVAHVAGRIYHPRLFDMENDERWLVGAANGTIHLPGNRGSHLVERVGQGDRGLFALRWLEPFNFPADLFTYEEEILKSYPPETHDGNLFMSYVRSQYIGQEIFEGFDYHYFSAPDRLVYEVSQVNDNGQKVQREDLEVAFHGNHDRIFATSIRTSNNKWLRGLRAGSYSRVHFDMWKDPKPYYHENFANRFQLISENWPFDPLPATVRPSIADEDGSYMHIFPNPNNGEFFIVPRGSGNVIPYNRFEIFDMRGRMIFNRSLNSDFNYVKIRLPQHLAEGVYHVIFKGPEAEEALRLVLAK